MCACECGNGAREGLVRGNRPGVSNVRGISPIKCAYVILQRMLLGDCHWVERILSEDKQCCPLQAPFPLSLWGGFGTRGAF